MTFEIEETVVDKVGEILTEKSLKAGKRQKSFDQKWSVYCILSSEEV